MNQDTHMLFIPPELRHSFFYKDGQIEKGSFSKMNTPFYDEIAYYNHLESVKPWENPEQFSKVILDQWRQLRSEIADVFKNRKHKEASKLMKQGLSYFIQYLFWTNGQPSTLVCLERWEDLKVQPINIGERLQFIIQRPNLHHAFIQLDELFVEQEKHFMKHLLIRKA